METIKDYSYGVIPVSKNDGKWQVFILNQISYRGSNNVYWTFPKGHPEEGESPDETALRELYEEAGLTPTNLDTSCTFDQEYTFLHEGKKINKKVSYFLGYIGETDKQFTLQPEEVKDGKWCTFEEAKKCLSHDIAKRMLDEVERYLISS